MTGFLHDLRYGTRQLRKSPGFTAVAIITLALGIGANTAIFSLLDQALLRHLPVKEPDRLVLLKSSGRYFGSSRSRGDDALSFSYPMYRDVRDRNSVFSGLIAITSAQVGVQWHNQPELADTELVSGNYFDVLGVQSALGRLFVPSDDVAQNANPVVVLSFNYWQRRFGLDPRILNQSISINGHPFTVIGVTQPSFRSVVVGDTPAIFTPMMMKPEVTPGWNDLDERRSQWLNIIGRLRPGITREQAEAGIDPLWHSIRADELKQMGHNSPDFRDAFLNKSHLFLLDGSKGLFVHGSLSTPLLIVTAMAGLVLLMACANVGSLLLVRMAGRMREMSVRYALGAKRRRVIRQLLVEGMLLGLAGGIAGLALAPQISAVLMRLMWRQTTGDLPFSSHPDLRIFVFNFVVALLVGLLFSLAPALQFWRPDVTPALKQQAAMVAGGPLQFRRIAVVVQIGMSLLLLFGAGLFVRTLRNLKTLDLGFTTDHLVTFTVDPRLAGYAPEQAVKLYQRILESVKGLPGVRSTAATNDAELANNNWGQNLTVAGYVPKEHEDMNVERARVSSRYCSTLGIPLLAGRELAEEDGAATERVAVVNESFAKHYFGQPELAVGRSFGWGAGNIKIDTEIVGVVKDAKHTTLRDEPRRTVFTPYLQETEPEAMSYGMTFYVRTWQSPETAEATIRSAMQQFDSKLVLDDFRTMHEQVDDSLSAERSVALLASSFGLLAALMAAVGVYGVLAYTTAQRTREIGIRIALGATRTTVLRMVLTEVLWLAGIGIAVGLPTSLLLTRTIRSQLFGISNNDPLTLCAVIFLVSALALASAALPARRAARVDPMVALRYE
jgi:putative ABC transport system permease protein